MYAAGLDVDERAKMAVYLLMASFGLEFKDNELTMISKADAISTTEELDRRAKIGLQLGMSLPDSAYSMTMHSGVCHACNTCVGYMSTSFVSLQLPK